MGGVGGEERKGRERVKITHKFPGGFAVIYHEDGELGQLLRQLVRALQCGDPLGFVLNENGLLDWKRGMK